MPMLQDKPPFHIKTFSYLGINVNCEIPNASFTVMKMQTRYN